MIAERLSEEEIGGLKELFKMIDTDNSGSITFEELKDGLKRVGSNLMESEIRDLMDAVSQLTVMVGSTKYNLIKTQCMLIGRLILTTVEQ